MIAESVTDLANPNHPKTGGTIKVEPIWTVNALNNLKKHIAPSRRNSAPFLVGINTAHRASEMLLSRIGQVRHLQPGDRLEVKQKRTKKYRAVTMNTGVMRPYSNCSSIWIAGRLKCEISLRSTMTPICSPVIDRIERCSCRRLIIS